jgi:hypothetical protein
MAGVITRLISTFTSSAVLFCSLLCACASGHRGVVGLGSALKFSVAIAWMHDPLH